MLCLIAAVCLLASPGRAAALVEQDAGAMTADGWRIALHHYAPQQRLFQEPVLLMHGFVENRRIWDLDPGHSLARVLAARGFDVWTMELRGSGASAAAPASPAPWGFSIEDFVSQDAPAAIAAVLRASGASQVLLVGHSLGGLVVYGTLEGPLAPKVRAAVTLAGVGTMSGGAALEPTLTKFLRLLGLTVGPKLPAGADFPLGATLHKTLGDSNGAWSALAHLLDSPLGRPFWEARDMGATLIQELLREAVTDTSLNVVKEFLSYAKQGRVSGITDRLSSIRTPLLALAGSEDIIIPPADVRAVAAAAGGEFTLIQGAGHEDICVGNSAPAAVYPRVADWLAAHATPAAAPDTTAGLAAAQSRLRAFLNRELPALQAAGFATPSEFQFP